MTHEELIEEMAKWQYEINNIAKNKKWNDATPGMRTIYRFDASVMYDMVIQWQDRKEKKKNG